MKYNYKIEDVGQINVFISNLIKKTSPVNYDNKLRDVYGKTYETSGIERMNDELLYLFNH